jgi:hypothetical protein
MTIMKEKESWLTMEMYRLGCDKNVPSILLIASSQIMPVINLYIATILQQTNLLRFWNWPNTFILHFILSFI